VAIGQAGSANLSQLSGAEKVAVLLLALGKNRAASLLKKFDTDELKLLTRSAADLRPVSMSDLEKLVEEFAQKFGNGVNFAGTVTEVKDLLSGVLTEEQFAEVLAEAPVNEEPVWERVTALGADQLRGFCAKEHPQTVAFILSRIDSAVAADVIASYASEVRTGLLCRMIGVKSITEDAARAVESVLREDLLGTSSQSSHVGIADILNRLDKAQSDEVLKSLAEVRPDEAKALKSLLFTFEDIARLSAASRTVVLDQVPIDRLVTALRGTDAAFQATILSSLAARSRRMVEAELQGGSTQSPREVADARRTIVAAVLKMMAKGEIQMETAEEPGAASAA
jgi:flagellar motor switch protein FliG